MPYKPPPELRKLSLHDIARLSKDRKLPPVHQWNPTSISDSKMQILADGRWFHDDGEIKRIAMIRAFSSLLRKDDDGFWLVTPYEKQSIIVEDAPFITTEMHNEYFGKDRQISFRLNSDDIICANAEHPIVMQALPNNNIPLPYIHVRDGMMAKMSRAIYYELCDIAIKESTEPIGIWSNDIFFSLEETS